MISATPVLRSACVIDARTGAGSNDKIYWRRNKVQRDVAVVFLLDTSGDGQVTFPEFCRYIIGRLKARAIGTDAEDEWMQEVTDAKRERFKDVRVQGAIDRARAEYEARVTRDMQAEQQARATSAARPLTATRPHPPPHPIGSLPHTGHGAPIVYL